MRDYLSENSWLDMGKLDYDIEENDLDGLLPSVHSKFNFMGKEIDNPRFDRVFGKDYQFSNVNHIADPIPDELKLLLDYVNNMGYGTYDQILVNWYMNGHHYIGSHADDEKQLIPNCIN